MLGLGEQILKFRHVFVGVANFAPFVACFGGKSGIRDKRVADAKNLGKRMGSEPLEANWLPRVS